MTIKVAGRQMPFIVDLLAERGDLNAIKALAHHKATRNS
jgi:hypothetical protein